LIFFNFIILLGTQTDRAVARIYQHQLSFLLPARCYASAVFTYGNVSVRPSLRLSVTAGIVSKRLNLS